MRDKTLIPKRIDNFEAIDLSDGVVVKMNDILHTLNSTAYEIFQLCDGQRTIQEIIDEMCVRYPDEEIATVIENFIDQLYSSELIRSLT